MTTPYEVLAKQLTGLGDKLSLSPVAREATVSSSAPLAVLFDTDTEETLAYGSLVASLTPGQRVLTLQLRHYVWILGTKGGSLDTGWIDLSSYMLPGFSGTLKGRARGGLVEIVAYVKGSFPSQVTATAITTAIPDALRPSVASRWGTVYAGGFTGGLLVREGGTMAIAQRVGTNWSGTAQGSISYITG